MPARTHDETRRLDLRNGQTPSKKRTPSAEGPGGADGIVLPLQFVWTKSGSPTYVLNVAVGGGGQQFPLQLDTGSSDLVRPTFNISYHVSLTQIQWVASTSCKACAGGRLYDPSTSLDTGQSFEINYIAGRAAGPIVWDKVSVGGYTLEHQALASANEVADEPLDAFSGVLGLALPLNSVIDSRSYERAPIDADGATWASNLFRMDGAPASRFISFLLERPGSTKIPSLLGIGRHPADYVPDPSKVHYSEIGPGNFAMFWEVDVTAITVYTDGLRKEVNTSRSMSGSASPTAVLDTGVPVILTTSGIANGIYGALGIYPASDKNYYVPCKTPLNMTISVNGVTIPLHPLDLTTVQDRSPQICLGTIQVADELLGSAHLSDMILGVPFLRSVYTVLAHDLPFANGSFNTGAVKKPQPFYIRPKLGLMGLTDPAIAMDEFHTVRVLGQPLSSTGFPDNGLETYGAASNRGLSVGLKVLIGLIGVFVFALLLFGIRFWWQRWKWNKSLRRVQQAYTSNGSGAEDRSDLPDHVQSGVADSGSLTTAQLRDLEVHKYMSREGIHSIYTVDTSRTNVEPDDRDGSEEMMVDELGLVYFGRPGKEKKGRNSTTSHSFPSFPADQAAVTGIGVGKPDEARLSRGFGITASHPSSSGVPEMEDSDQRRSDADPLLGSQPRSSAEWNDSPFPAVEPSSRGDVGPGWGEEPGTRDSMIGVGAYSRSKPSDEYMGQLTLSGPRTSSSGLPAPGVPRRSEAQSSFDHTAEDPLSPPSPQGRNRP